jgi:hypothetical protein
VDRPDLPRRLVTAVTAALAPEPEARPHASVLSGELRASVKAPQARPAARGDSRPAVGPAASSVSFGTRLLPAALAGVAAAVGVTILPFWPTILAVAIVAGAVGVALVSPRAALAIALAAPVFPFGNVSQGAALLYSSFALAWLVAFWREARLALLFVVGPLLAGLGLLALVPLAVQPVAGVGRRAAQGALAVLAAGLVAALAGDALPAQGVRIDPLGIGPADSAQSIAVTVAGALGGAPLLLAAALATGLGAALLPRARSVSRYGVPVLGAVFVGGAIAAGAGIAAVAVLVVVWGTAAAIAAGTDR